MLTENQLGDKQVQWVKEKYLGQVGGSNDFEFFHSSSLISVCSKTIAGQINFVFNYAISM